MIGKIHARQSRDKKKKKRESYERSRDVKENSKGDSKCVQRRLFDSPVPSVSVAMHSSPIHGYRREKGGREGATMGWNRIRDSG